MPCPPTRPMVSIACSCPSERYMKRFIPQGRPKPEPPVPAKSSNAFTLTELLVVLAVLALLTATLLPALAMDKGNSKLAQCLANHRQIGAACAMYADDFSGWYPITSVGSANSYPGSVNHLLGIWYTRYVYTPPGGPGIAMPQTLQPDQDQNLGYLYADGLVSSGHVFFCPSFDVADTNAPLYPLSANYYSNPRFMSTAGPAGDDAIRSSYMFNPRLVNAAGSPTSSDILRRYQKTSDVKSRDVFTVDGLVSVGSLGVPFNPDDWPHWPYKGLPVGFTDGSAKFCTITNAVLFNAIVNNLASSGENQLSAEQYDTIFNLLRDSP
jgi:prepilin-type N-terminal cleavage/methylation domain-containing protein